MNQSTSVNKDHEFSSQHTQKGRYKGPQRTFKDPQIETVLGTPPDFRDLTYG